MRVISASRRTDIPAFYMPWLMNRLRAGFCHVASPYGGPVARVSLRAEDVIALVFWTRNPAPLLPHLDELQGAGYRFYAGVTVTGYPRALEPHAPAAEAAIDAMRRLAEAISPEFVIWRYDPILCSGLTPAESHPQHFAALARALEGAVRRCVISFTDFYHKTTHNLARVLGLAWQNPPVEEKRKLAEELAAIAAAHGMELCACCEEELTCGMVRPAHCVDPELIHRLRPDLPAALKAAPSRAGCGCAESTDIGAYDTCAHGCTYCYATSSPATALTRLREHDPADTILWRPSSLRGVAIDASEPDQKTLNL